ncbi:MAG: hemolysin family protein, partial [Sphingomonas sp.]
MQPLPPFPWIDVAIIFALVIVNGGFAMSELAIVSSRKARLEAMARADVRGARTAVELAANPGKLLSTTQIGITLIGIISGAYSGASLGGPTAARLVRLGVSPGWAETLGFTLVIGVTTYASLVVGELVPKQIALRSPERIAAVVAVPMRWLARATAPIVWLLDSTSGLLFALLRLTREAEDDVTAEELHLIVAEASKSGVIEEHERSIISGVVRLADRPVREVMTPRTDVEWLDATLDEAGVRAALATAQHSRMPLGEGSIDRIVGVVQARDVAQALVSDKALDLMALRRDAPVVVDQIDAMDALNTLRAAEVPMALIHDEYGHFEGLVTPANLLAAIAGEFASDTGPDVAPWVVEREDGSLLVAGQMPVDLLAE